MYEIAGGYINKYCNYADHNIKGVVASHSAISVLGSLSRPLNHQSSGMCASSNPNEY
jgi:hypothetical protein